MEEIDASREKEQVQEGFEEPEILQKSVKAEFPDHMDRIPVSYYGASSVNDRVDRSSLPVVFVPPIITWLRFLVLLLFVHYLFIVV